MKKQILKYTLEITGEQEMRIPAGSELLSVINQRDKLVAYFLEPERLTGKYDVVHFFIVGTGHLHDAQDYDERHYIDTVAIFDDASLILHIFSNVRKRGTLCGDVPIVNGVAIQKS